MEVYNPDEKQNYKVQADGNLATTLNLIKVYSFFAIGLLITAGMIFGFQPLLKAIVNGFNITTPYNQIYNGTLIGFLVALFIFGMMSSLSIMVNRAWFVGLSYFMYALCFGGAMSSLTNWLDTNVIGMAFGVSGAIFIVCGIIGVLTKGKLNKWANFLFMLVLGSIVISIVNIFLRSSTLSWITSFVILLVFLFITAIDVDRVHRLASEKGFNNNNCLALYEAYCLYADFAVIFSYVIRIVAASKNN
jgi:uncharacterized protein